jgi:hypothetical protein
VHLAIASTQRKRVYFFFFFAADLAGAGESVDVAAAGVTLDGDDDVEAAARGAVVETMGVAAVEDEVASVEALATGAFVSPVGVAAGVVVDGFAIAANAAARVLAYARRIPFITFLRGCKVKGNATRDGFFLHNTS